MCPTVYSIQCIIFDTDDPVHFPASRSLGFDSAFLDFRNMVHSCFYPCSSSSLLNSNIIVRNTTLSHALPCWNVEAFLFAVSSYRACTTTLASVV